MHINPKKDKGFIKYMQSMRKAILLFFLFVFVVGLYFIYNPEYHSLFPRCIFLHLTGYKCVGCGSQRAIHSLLHFDLASAIRYNALLVIFIPYMIMLFISTLWKSKLPTIYAILTHHIVIKTIFVIVLFWAVLRNIYNW